MSTTGPVMTITDELLAELELFESGDCCVPAKALLAVTAELRRLRAENAELAKDAGRYRWLRKLTDFQYWTYAQFDSVTDTLAEQDDAIDTAMAAQ